MKIKLTEHARERANERGTTEDEIRLVLTTGEEAGLKKHFFSRIAESL